MISDVYVGMIGEKKVEIKWHMEHVGLDGNGTIITDEGKGFVFCLGKIELLFFFFFFFFLTMCIRLISYVYGAKYVCMYVYSISGDMDKDHYLCHYHLLDVLGVVERDEANAHAQAAIGASVDSGPEISARTFGKAKATIITHSIRRLIQDVYFSQDNWEKELRKVANTILSDRASKLVEKISQKKYVMTATWATTFTNGQSAQQRAESKNSHTKQGAWKKLLKKGGVHVITNRVLQMESEQVQKTKKKIKQLHGEWSSKKIITGISAETHDHLTQTLTVSSDKTLFRVLQNTVTSTCMFVEHWSTVENMWFTYKVHFTSVKYLEKEYNVPVCECVAFRRTKRPCGGVVLFVQTLGKPWTEEFFHPRWRVTLHPLYKAATSLPDRQQRIPVNTSVSSAIHGHVHSSVPECVRKYPKTTKEKRQRVLSRVKALLAQYSLNDAAFSEWCRHLDNVEGELKLTVQRQRTRTPLLFSRTESSSSTSTVPDTTNTGTTSASVTSTVKKFVIAIKNLPAAGEERKSKQQQIQNQLQRAKKDTVKGVVRALNLNVAGLSNRQGLASRAVTFGHLHWIAEAMRTAPPNTNNVAVCTTNQDLVNKFHSLYERKKGSQDAKTKAISSRYRSIQLAIAKIPIAINSSGMLQAIVFGIGDNSSKIVDEVIAKRRPS